MAQFLGDFDQDDHVDLFLFYKDQAELDAQDEKFLLAMDDDLEAQADYMGAHHAYYGLQRQAVYHME